MEESEGAFVRLSNWSKKKTVLILRWLLVISTAYIILFSNGIPELLSLETILIATLLASNCILWKLPSRVVEWVHFDQLVIILDTTLVSFCLYITKSVETDFYLVYLLIIMVTTVGKDIRQTVNNASLVTGIYGFMLFRQTTLDEIMSPTVFLRLPFLFVISIFYGYLTDIARREKWLRNKIETEKRDLEFLLEITHTISSTLRAEEVMKIVVEKVSRVLDIKRCSVLFTTGNILNGGFVLISNDDPNLKELEINLEKYPEVQQAMKEKELVVVEDALSDPLTSSVSENLKNAGFRSLMIVPMVYGKDVLGTLFLRLARAEGGFTERERKFCQIVANAAANALKNAQLFEKLRHQAITDGLTEMYNHRHFQDRFRVEAEKAKEFGHHLTLIMVDIDNFKWINDYYGHAIGDEAIKYISKKLKENSREGDIVARYGGDEFVWLLTNTDADQAVKVADRFLKSVSREPFDAMGILTVSIGVSTYPTSTKNVTRLIQMADRAMYKAKAEGGNKVRTFTPEEVKNIIDWGETLK
ncbi:MAG: diguanylate cyclase [Candidatus Glassbacteria bacterium]